MPGIPRNTRTFTPNVKKPLNGLLRTRKKSMLRVTHITVARLLFPTGRGSFAAKKVAGDKDGTAAAIASEYAAKLYGLHVLEKGVNHSSSNSTRFIIVTNQKIFRKDAKKVSICFEVPHESGSLYHMLSHFIYNNLNMNKIESRPIEDRNWEYRFFIDFDGNLSDSSVKNALRGLREEARNMKILGNY